MQPLDALRTVVSAMSGSEAEAPDNSHEGTVRKGIRITAIAPTILAAHSRMSRGKDPIAPNGSLGHAANFLYMLTGEMPTVTTAAPSTRPSSFTLSTAQTPPRSLRGLSLPQGPTCFRP